MSVPHYILEADNLSFEVFPRLTIESTSSLTRDELELWGSVWHRMFSFGSQVYSNGPSGKGLAFSVVSWELVKLLEVWPWGRSSGH